MENQETLSLLKQLQNDMTDAIALVAGQCELLEELFALIDSLYDSCRQEILPALECRYQLLKENKDNEAMFRLIRAKLLWKAFIMQVENDPRINRISRIDYGKMKREIAAEEEGVL